jgi:hypothetical protein
MGCVACWADHRVGRFLGLAFSRSREFSGTEASMSRFEAALCRGIELLTVSGEFHS